MKLVNKMVAGLVVAGGLGLSSVAVAGVSGNIAASSDYLWRGVTQTNHTAAVSGGLDYAHDAGIYAGTWVSNVAADTEIDVYGGFSKEFGGVGVDLGYILYHYPVAAPDFAEVYIGLSYSMVSAMYSYDMENEDAYLSADASYEVKKGLSLSVNFGAYMYSVSDNDYMTYGATITKAVGDWEAAFAASATDLEAGPNAEPTAFVSISRGFDL